MEKKNYPQRNSENIKKTQKKTFCNPVVVTKHQNVFAIKQYIHTFHSTKHFYKFFFVFYS